MRCPCQSALFYDDCCGLYHRAIQIAPTATALMRSRYSAFALGLSDYLLASWHPSTRPKRLGALPSVEWTSLRIIDAEGGERGDEAGIVEFMATCRDKLTHKTETLHERSRFLFEKGAQKGSQKNDQQGTQKITSALTTAQTGFWYYLDGVHS